MSNEYVHLEYDMSHLENQSNRHDVPEYIDIYDTCFLLFNFFFFVVVLVMHLCTENNNLASIKIKKS